MITTIKNPKDAKLGRIIAYLKQNFESPKEMNSLPDGLPDDIYEASMRVAYSNFERGLYLDARQVFSFLCCQRPTDPRTWMGIGICRQRTGEYLKAAKAFNYCTQLNEFDPRPHYHRGVCLMHLGKIEESTNALNIAIRWCPKKNEYAGIQARSRFFLNELSLKNVKENKDGYRTNRPRQNRI